VRRPQCVAGVRNCLYKREKGGVEMAIKTKERTIRGEKRSLRGDFGKVGVKRTLYIAVSIRKDSLRVEGSSDQGSTQVSKHRLTGQ